MVRDFRKCLITLRVINKRNVSDIHNFDSVPALY